MLADKYHMTKDQNRRFARSNLTKLVHTNARFEGVNTTMPQTQTIIDGLGVDGVSIDDINVIVQLKRGWQSVINADKPLTLDFAKKINGIVALHESLAPGELRTGNGYVNTNQGEFIPPEVDIDAENTYLKQLLNGSESTTEKALQLMYQPKRLYSSCTI